MATRFMYKAFLTAALGIALSFVLAAPTTASPACSNTVAQPVSDQTSTVFDAVGDAGFNAPAFQDIVRAEMTRTAGGDFELLMEMAGPVPVAPTLPPPASREIWWLWIFDLDPATSPSGYPVSPGLAQYPEFLVYVSWDGAEFTGTAIDRRPLLTGGEAIITSVPFSIDGGIVEAVLPSPLIGNVPASFHWGSSTRDWSGPLGSNSTNGVDGAGLAIFP